MPSDAPIEGYKPNGDPFRGDRHTLVIDKDPNRLSASSQTSPNLPPMGMRVRLKAGYQIPGDFSTEAKAILQALKTYGMMVADNGSNWYISGAPADGWNNGRLNSELGQVTGADFEVVKMGKVYTK